MVGPFACWLAVRWRHQPCTGVRRTGIAGTRPYGLFLDGRPGEGGQASGLDEVATASQFQVCGLGGRPRAGRAVVAVMPDGCGLAAGLAEFPGGLTAAARSAVGTGQQQAQSEQGECPDHDAVREAACRWIRSRGSRTPANGWVSACPVPLLPRTPATPAINAATRMMSRGF